MKLKDLLIELGVSAKLAPQVVKIFKAAGVENTLVPEHIVKRIHTAKQSLESLGLR